MDISVFGVIAVCVVFLLTISGTSAYHKFLQTAADTEDDLRRQIRTEEKARCQELNDIRNNIDAREHALYTRIEQIYEELVRENASLVKSLKQKK